MDYRHELWKFLNRERKRVSRLVVSGTILIAIWILVLLLIPIMIIAYWYNNDTNTFMQVLKWSFDTVWFLYLYAILIGVLLPSFGRLIEYNKEIENKLQLLTASSNKTEE